MSKDTKTVTKIPTVNVLEIVDVNLINITSYTETPQGNIDAEERFADVMKDMDDSISDEDIKISLDDGFFEKGDNTVYIIHTV